MAPVGAILLAAFLFTAFGLAGQAAPIWTVSREAVEMGKGADELFESVRFGRYLPDGYVVVADAGGMFLRIYGPDGGLRAEMGGKGGGPGEFRSIHGVWVTPQGRIGVWDPLSRRFTTFDAQGGLVDTHPVEPPEELSFGNLEVFLGRFSDGDVLLASLHGERSRTGSVDRWVLARFSLMGTFLGWSGEVQGMRRAGRAPLPFSPVPRVAVGGDSMWVAEGYEPVITVRGRDGSVIRTIDLPWTVRPSGDPWSALEAELRRRAQTFYLELFDEAPRTDRFPTVGGLLIDERGRLWVKVYDPVIDSLWLKRNALEIAPGGEWRVLGPTGASVGTVRMPDHLIPLDVRGDRLLAVARDAWDVERVVVHMVGR